MIQRFKKVLLPVLMLVLMASGFNACTTNVYFPGMRAADVTVPGDIKTVVLVNRFKPSRENRWKAVTEAIFTGEMIGADKEGAQNALSVFADKLGRSPRYKVVMANYSMFGNGMGFFPEPLSQADIQRLCNDFGADAVVSIEAFDSDIGIFCKQEERKYTSNEDKKEHTRTVWVAHEDVNLTMGWRMYRKDNAAIIDEYKLYSRKSFTAEGDGERSAKMNLANPMVAIRSTAVEGGNMYADRIAPEPITYVREFYGTKTGYPAMKNAKRKVRANDWDGAVAIWQNLLKINNRKLQGRACYNIAVACEAKGDLDGALEWAKKAAEQYNNKMAFAYINKLNYRIDNEIRVKQQLGN